MNHYERVTKFMALASQSMPGRPTDLDPETREFRAKLIYEECVRELIGEGLGVTIAPNSAPTMDITDKNLSMNFEADKPFDMVHLADGCADGLVVITGSGIAAGLDLDPIQKIVDENNLEKFGPGGYRSDGSDGNTPGKWIKPKDHRPPDITGELARQGYVFPSSQGC